MAKTEAAASRQAERLGSILGIIWDDVVHEVNASRKKSLDRYDFEDVARRIIENSNILNGSTAAFAAQFNAITKSPWLTSNERRFAIAVALARHLANRAIDKCENEQSATSVEKRACSEIKKLPQDKRAPVLGAIILAPEPEFRKVCSTYHDDALMVSSAFSIPLDAARLRINYDNAVT